MPYKNREDRIAYYHRHQKFYQSEWIERNRDKWNEYQRLRKREQKKLSRENKSLNKIDNEFYQQLCEEEARLSQWLTDIRTLKSKLEIYYSNPLT